MGQFTSQHYGHLLTEGLSRYWYIANNALDGAKIPTLVDPFGMEEIVKSLLHPQQSHWREFLRAFRIRRGDIFVTKEPVQASEILVPHPSMTNRHEMLPCHLDVTRKAAAQILGKSIPLQDPTPVWLSRAKLKKKTRAYIGEQAIEDYCREQGCLIVYPEQMSLRKQIALFNAHDTFIGCTGSAFHTVMFRIVDRPANNVYLLSVPANSNYHMIDTLMENNSHYISCAEESAGPRKTWKLDYNDAVGGLNAVMGWKSRVAG